MAIQKKTLNGKKSTSTVTKATTSKSAPTPSSKLKTAVRIGH